MKKLISRLKKGISIVEVVIAIAVISIISVAAVSTLTYSIKAQNKNLRDFDIATTCDTVIDCFRFSDDYDTLLAEIYGSEYDSTKKEINRKNYILEISIVDKTLTLTAVDGEKLLYQTSYTKDTHVSP